MIVWMYIILVNRRLWRLINNNLEEMGRWPLNFSNSINSINNKLDSKLKCSKTMYKVIVKRKKKNNITIKNPIINNIILIMFNIKLAVIRKMTKIHKKMQRKIKMKNKVINSNRKKKMNNNNKKKKNSSNNNWIRKMNN